MYGWNSKTKTSRNFDLKKKIDNPIIKVEKLYYLYIVYSIRRQ